MIEYELSIDVTYRCPFICPFCSSPPNPSYLIMNMEIAQSCVEFIRGLCCNQNNKVNISITGGEPLSLSSLPSLVSLFASGLNGVNLCTTAALNMGKNYWYMLHSRGLRTVRLSLHSIAEDKCRHIFGSAYSFSTVDKNLTLMTTAGIIVEANVLVTQLSIAGFNEVWKYCFKKGIKKVRVLGLCKQGRAILNWNRLSVSQQDVALFIKHIRGLSIEYGLYAEFSGFANHRLCVHSDNSGRCLGGSSFFHINTNGDIFACPAVKAIPAKKMGSVLRISEDLAKQTSFPCILIENNLKYNIVICSKSM